MTPNAAAARARRNSIVPTLVSWAHTHVFGKKRFLLLWILLFLLGLLLQTLDEQRRLRSVRGKTSGQQSMVLTPGRLQQ